MSKSINTRTKYRIIGSDYSAQEPRMACFISNDENMLSAYLEGKDLYAVIAAAALGTTYENCLEFWPEGTELEIDGKKVIAGYKTHLNKQGKENRNIGKKVLLASMYGMGASTAGVNMNKTPEEAQVILDNFFAKFKQLKKAIDDSQKFLKEHEYVEDFLGRRRRLPEVNLQPYTIELRVKTEDLANFNPILGCSDREVVDAKILKWQNRIQEEIEKSNAIRQKYAKPGEKVEYKNEMSNKAFDALVKEAAADGVIIHANTGRIAQALRQCFNARIQGGAASLTKLAMVDIYNDKIMNDCQAKLIIPVHDELLVECPAYYAEIVEKRLPEVMINAAKRGGDNVPQACDPYNVSRWYSDTMAATLLDEYKKLEAKGKTKDEATEIICKNHIEIQEASILDVLTGKTEEIIM